MERRDSGPSVLSPTLALPINPQWVASSKPPLAPGGDSLWPPLTQKHPEALAHPGATQGSSMLPRTPLCLPPALGSPQDLGMGLPFLKQLQTQILPVVGAGRREVGEGFLEEVAQQHEVEKGDPQRDGALAHCCRGLG